MADNDTLEVDLSDAMVRLAQFSVATHMGAIHTGVQRLLVAGMDGEGRMFVFDLSGLLDDVSALMLAQVASLQEGRDG